MSTAGVRLGIGTRIAYDGGFGEVVELSAGEGRLTAILCMEPDHRILRIAARELFDAGRARVLSDTPGPSPQDDDALAAAILKTLTAEERLAVLDRAAHIREVRTGYRSGHEELSTAGEPRPEYDPGLPFSVRYEAKARELGVTSRTIRNWVADYLACGEAGLVPQRLPRTKNPYGRVDQRWIEAALEVMVEHTAESRPSRLMVISRATARVTTRFGEGVVAVPSKSAAYRVLEELERRHPLFRLSTKRNRDIADRPDTAYGKLRPVRPGEYVLMDTTRLDVFALDPATLLWVQAELTVAMDWYTRCIVGIRLTPVSTKSVDAAATLYEVFRPLPASPGWPAYAVWPDHGIPRSVLIDVDAIEGPMTGLSHPAIVPDTIVIDHGKIYVSEHLTSVCQRLGISIQPARLRTGRDKGPVERFFRTLREDLLQALPGYKGPDVHSRGVDPEGAAFFYLDELEAIIREWVALVYHHRPHGGLVDPHLPTLELSPAAMFEHGVQRGGYIEVPRDPDLAYEFLAVKYRSIQHYGVEWGDRIYKGDALAECDEKTIWVAGKRKRGIPIHVNPDDIRRVFVRTREREWCPLVWEHAASLTTPFSEDALVFARRLAAAKYTYPGDRLAIADLLDRWHLGLGDSMAERRIALRMSRTQAGLLGDLSITATEVDVTELPLVAQILGSAKPPLEQIDSDAGDEDAADEVDDEPTDPEDDGGGDGDDFYADALENI
ncbi:transposase [Nocardia yunnanensis]|uniref:Transposase n=1 Tax=Nocardia yunnanensis TaxID=2382165 RepID=A0A386ZDX1_9NOCA|nr:DDE-type integrase/transposase/recombinase [Nocardia yunnanensis]AYF76072.1 transposase [Nocardia yunnanensis]